jgi:putative RNA 2'-phosphotransferase
VSKYLARHLRHEPERLGIALDPSGWVSVEELLSACAERSFALTFDELVEVVERNDKRRFSFDASQRRIRANQGHSVELDLALEATAPPRHLFHGTSRDRLSSIMEDGLQRMGRHHVHLSEDSTTAESVGRRHGRPVVLQIQAGEMSTTGLEFFVTSNNVWLTYYVAPRFIGILWDQAQATERHS